MRGRSATNTHLLERESQASLQGSVAKRKVEPLPRQFFAEMIKLEIAFRNDKFTVDTLEDLTQYYAKCVEYYDNIKDAISAYFLYKIQDTLATKESLKKLIDSQAEEARRNSKTAPRRKPRKISDQYSDGDESEEKSEDQLQGSSSTEETKTDLHKLKPPSPKKALKQQRQRSRGSFSVMKTERAKFVNYYVQVEKTKKDEKQTMDDIMGQFDTVLNDCDKIVRTSLSMQKKQLRERVEQRKVRSFLERTGSSLGSSQILEDKSGMSDILAEIKRVDEENKNSESENGKRMSTELEGTVRHGAELVDGDFSPIKETREDSDSDEGNQFGGFMSVKKVENDENEGEVNVKTGQNENNSDENNDNENTEATDNKEDDQGSSKSQESNEKKEEEAQAEKTEVQEEKNEAREEAVEGDKNEVEAEEKNKGEAEKNEIEAEVKNEQQVENQEEQAEEKNEVNNNDEEQTDENTEKAEEHQEAEVKNEDQPQQSEKEAPESQEQNGEELVENGESVNKEVPNGESQEPEAQEQE